MTKIFISYRRQDTLAITGRIYDKLAEAFGRNGVFMDFDHIPLGIDFRKHLKDTLQQCDLLLVVIGPHWLGTDPVVDPNKLWETTDYVRLEIEIALNREIPVIPVLIGRASLPSHEHLPPEIQPLLYRQAASVDIGQDFHNHMDRLIEGIKNIHRSHRSTLHESKIRMRRVSNAYGTYLNTLARVLVWSTIGFIAGFTSQAINSYYAGITVLVPGFFFGAAIYFFGEYSTSCTLSRLKRAISYGVLTVGSTSGWVLAFLTAILFNDLNSTIGFIFAGVVGGTLIVVAEIWCWHLPRRRWTYAIVVVLTAGLVGIIVELDFDRGSGIYGLAIWQALVLGSTEIATRFAGTNDRLSGTHQLVQ
jgi:hypothetical protein